MILASDGRAGVPCADASPAELAFAAHQALLKVELENPALAQNSCWVTLRSETFDLFLAQFEAGR